MRNLLSAGMFRLLKSKLLYVALGASILLEVYTLLPERDRLRLLAIPLEKAVFAYFSERNTGAAPFGTRWRLELPKGTST